MGVKRNKCAHPNCIKFKPVEQYACRDHWFGLPKKVRDKIHRGFRTSNGDLWFAAHKEAQEFWGVSKVPTDGAGLYDGRKRVHTGTHVEDEPNEDDLLPPNCIDECDDDGYF
jgi:hypothetical protein